MSLGEQVVCPLPKRSQLHRTARTVEQATVHVTVPFPANKPVRSTGLYPTRRENAVAMAALAKRSAHKPSAPKSERFHSGSSRTSGVSRIGGSVITTGVLAAVLAAPAAGSTVIAASNADDGMSTTAEIPVSGPLEQSWVNFNADSLTDTGDLVANPAAASRARVRVPVEVRPCMGVEGAANGSRTVLEQQMVYQPLREGTYVNSSPYGYRFHPVTGAYSLHEGDDYSAPAGTPIYAVADGVVIEVTYSGLRGYYTTIEHTMQDGSVVHSLYLHQTAGSQMVSAGEQVKAGQQIGQVGSTGRSTGSHLHLEIRDTADNSMSPSAWLAANNAVFIGEGCE